MSVETETARETTAVYRVKIFGAGSIGNHLAHAARQLGWDVTVCDLDDRALARMREQIYPARYGAWDPAIRQVNNQSAPVGGFDVILIGTPPEHHLPLALTALEERPRAIQIEKPLCPPSLERGQELFERAATTGTRVFVGYDHVVGKAAQRLTEVLRSGILGDVQTIDVEFREHWEGIFKAHPWLNGPEDSYLGFWERGGGASGEHSHALNIWQYLAHEAGAGRIAEVSATLRCERDGRATYDSLCLLNLRTETGLVGRVVQDVVTRPPVKRARIQGTLGAVELAINFNLEGDAMLLRLAGQPETIELFPKKRPDDFIEELKHIAAHLEPAAPPSPLRLERGLETMLAVAAAHRSERDGRRIRLDYSQGFSLQALDGRP
jgi:predicted dehydrogenase